MKGLAILFPTMVEPFKVCKPHFQKLLINHLKAIIVLWNDKFGKSLAEFNYKLRNKEFKINHKTLNNIFIL